MIDTHDKTIEVATFKSSTGIVMDFGDTGGLLFSVVQCVR